MNGWLITITSLSFVMMAAMIIFMWFLYKQASDNYEGSYAGRQGITTRLREIERVVGRINNRALKAARAEKKAAERQDGGRPLEL